MRPEEGALVIVALFCQGQLAVDMEYMACLLVGFGAVNAQHRLHALLFQNAPHGLCHKTQIIVPGAHDKGGRECRGDIFFYLELLQQGHIIIRKIGCDHGAAPLGRKEAIKGEEVAAAV